MFRVPTLVNRRRRRVGTAALPRVPSSDPQVTSPPRPARAPLGTGKKVAFLLLMLTFAWLAGEGVILYQLLDDDFYWRRGKQSRLVNEMPDNLVPNPRYIFGYQPGSQFTYTDPRDAATYHVAINSEGFRDEQPADRADVDFPFVALGDSFTFGWLVEQPDRWDEQLAKSIREKHGVAAASINRGMWMSTFDQHALVLEDNFPEKCSAVIHFVYPSHLQTINRHVVETRDGKIVSIQDPLLHLKDGAAYYGAAARALISKQITFPFSVCRWRFRRNVRELKAKLTQGSNGSAMSDEQIYQQASQGSFRHGYELMERSIAQTAAFLKEKNVPYIVVIIPRDRQLDAREWNGEPPVAEMLSSSIPQEQIRRACEATGHAVCLDLLPTMRNNYHDKLYYRVDPHWTSAGHKLAAEEVRKLLERRGLLARYRVKRTATKP